MKIHLLNVPQLVELLEAQGIRCERKSVYSDIEALGALGYDIKLRRGRGGGYFLASRTFDLAELKLLVDAVQGKPGGIRHHEQAADPQAGKALLQLRGQPAAASGLCGGPSQDRQQEPAVQHRCPARGHQQR